MSTVPRLVFLNRFYWPEEPATGQLLTDLAEALARNGEHEVHVVTSAAGPALPKVEIRHAVHIRRVRTFRFGGRGALARAWDWFTFGLAALWRVARDCRRDDTWVFLTDPPLLAVVAAPLARWRGARVIHYVQDIYPELPEVLNGTRGLGFLRVLRDRAWRKADACVVLGTDMAAFLRHRGVDSGKIHIIPNWAPHGLAAVPDTARAAVRQRWGLADKFIVAYSGNLGRVHDLEPIIAAAIALKDHPSLVFVFIGDGAQRRSLEAQVQAASLPNVRFLPHQPRAELAASLGAADVHLVTLRTGCEALVFPSKLYGIAAVGRPMLFIGPADCEIARLVRDTGMGRAFGRLETSALAQTLRDWQQDSAPLVAHARQAADFARINGGADRAAAAWRVVLTQIRH